jgi:hypothetical protein
MTLFAGLAGGLAGVLWSGIVTTPWLARAGLAHGETAFRLFVGAGLRAFAGAVMGLLFWLGWGLIAVVGQPWQAIGLLYGVLCWTAMAVPVLGTLLLRGRVPAHLVLAHAVEWLFTCGTIGLLCALAWHRYA